MKLIIALTLVATQCIAGSEKLVSETTETNSWDTAEKAQSKCL